MQASVVAVLLLCASAVLSQAPPIQKRLDPYIGDGFETVFLDDMSFVTEFHIQNFPPDNWTFFIFGSNTVRTVHPEGPTFYVGPSPDPWWIGRNFIDIHMIQNGTDLFAFGPVNGNLNSRSPYMFGYNLDIAVLSTKTGRNNDYDTYEPLGFEGTFFAVRPFVFNFDILGYFVGYYPKAWNETWNLEFGVVRARYDLNAERPNQAPQNWTRWHYNYTVDKVAISNNTQFITYNEFYKPQIHHLWNVTTAHPNVTYTIVVDPGTHYVRTILGDFDPTVPLTLSNNFWHPTAGDWAHGTITTSKICWSERLLILGLRVAGQGTGAVVFLNIADLTEKGRVNLPTNYSDPKAIAVDEFSGHVYVAMNGGGAVIRIDSKTFNITGYQRVPRYLERAWDAIDTPQHVYFITNEQHSKVFRLHKTNLCETECSEFGYCHERKCVCGQGFDLSDGKCVWHTEYKDRETIKKDKGGLAALGVFFALSTVAAGAGWYLVWKSKRQGYQAV